MLPFVLAGRLYGKLFPLKEPTNVFLFFSSADIGGAPKVNADIADCLAAEKPLIIFSKKPKNNGHEKLFAHHRILDLHRKIDDKRFHFVNFFYRGVLASWINQSDNPVIMGGETIYFYKVLAHVKKKTRRIELCHLDTWLPYSIGFIDLIDARVFSTLKLQQQVEAQYRTSQVPEPYFKRLSFIENQIDIPPYQEVQHDVLQVVFIGRGSPQKRVPLTAAIAQRLHERKAPVHFSFVGDVENVIDTSLYPFCTFYGNVRDEQLMNRLYRESDVLIMTSAFEGLPLVVMQMMAHAKIVLSTAVNAIPDYIGHMENGLLIRATAEDKIVEEGVELIDLLIREPSLKTKLGKRSRELAIEKFSHEVFCRQYRELFLP